MWGELYLKGLSPEQRLAGLKPEDRLVGLSKAELQRIFKILKKEIDQ
jgi:hypothetical protein